MKNLSEIHDYPTRLRAQLRMNPLNSNWQISLKFYLNRKAKRYINRIVWTTATKQKQKTTKNLGGHKTGVLKVRKKCSRGN